MRDDGRPVLSGRHPPEGVRRRQTERAGTITAATSNAACATVAPTSAVATKPMGSSVYVATFTVTPVGAGTCTITLRDTKANQVQTPIIVTAVRLRRETLVGGTNFTCGLSAGGAAYCWGLNVYGTLGTRNNLGTFNANPTPVVVSGNLTFVSLGAGFFQACGLTGAGAAYCWGSGAGLGTTKRVGPNNTSTTPLAVEGGIRFVALTVGGSHACGLTDAGSAYCWGNNFFGQLGTPANSGVTGPGIPTPTAVGGGHTFVALTAGSDHTCGLTPLGAAYCWGDNTYLALGDPASPDTVQITPTPVGVSGGLTFVQLSAGGASTCGLTSDGTAYCWGRNFSGELGTTTSLGQATATPQAVSGGLQFAEIRSGGSHACGRTSGGAAYCWGSNFYGQLGTTADNNIPNATQPTPVAVDGGLAIAALTAGGQHTCGLSIAGVASCWGLNNYGELGNATNTGVETANPAPMAVSGGLILAVP